MHCAEFCGATLALGCNRLNFRVFPGAGRAPGDGFIPCARGNCLITRAILVLGRTGHSNDGASTIVPGRGLYPLACQTRVDGLEHPPRLHVPAEGWGYSTIGCQIFPTQATLPLEWRSLDAGVKV